MNTSSRKILLVVTVGGFTHAAPVLELGRVLASRGHAISFATLEGQDSWTSDYPFISETYLVGPGPSESDLEAHYLRKRGWDAKKGFSDMMESKYIFDSYWTQTYEHLKRIMVDEEKRPDMIVADFFVDAVKDMNIQFKIPIAIVWPQMPYLMLRSPYIPGQPGFQVDPSPTSEHASLRAYLRNELVLLWAIPTILRLLKWTKSMRRKAGVQYPLPMTSKPNYLVLVNTFFGLETPQDLPPLAACVGPIISDQYAGLGEEYWRYLEKHKKTIYVALGSHVILPREDATKIVHGLALALSKGLINGVIWAVGLSGRKEFDRRLVLTMNSKETTFGALLDGIEQNWMFPTFAPQRAILDHPSTKVYFTHGGGSSANEGLFHGAPMIAMGIFFDQIANSAKLAKADLRW